MTGCTLAKEWDCRQNQQEYDTQLASTTQGLLQAAPSLTTLALAHTGLKKAVPALLPKHCTGLRALDLQGPADSLQECIPELCHLTALTSLALDAAVRSSVAAQLARSLRHLRELHLPQVKISSIGVLDALLAATQLTGLTVGACVLADHQ
jgi:hypothetical protein